MFDDVVLNPSSPPPSPLGRGPIADGEATRNGPLPSFEQLLRQGDPIAVDHRPHGTIVASAARAAWRAGGEHRLDALNQWQDVFEARPWQSEDEHRRVVDPRFGERETGSSEAGERDDQSLRTHQRAAGDEGDSQWSHQPMSAPADAGARPREGSPRGEQSPPEAAKTNAAESPDNPEPSPKTALESGPSPGVTEANSSFTAADGAGQPLATRRPGHGDRMVPAAPQSLHEAAPASETAGPGGAESEPVLTRQQAADLARRLGPTPVRVTVGESPEPLRSGTAAALLAASPLPAAETSKPQRNTASPLSSAEPSSPQMNTAAAPAAAEPGSPSLDPKDSRLPIQAQPSPPGPLQTPPPGQPGLHPAGPTPGAPTAPTSAAEPSPAITAAAVEASSLMEAKPAGGGEMGDGGEFTTAIAPTTRGARPVGATIAAHSNGQTTPRAVTEQVFVQMARAAKAGIDRIHIQLHPASLGRVEVRLDLGHDGRVAATVIADRPDTLEMLKSDARGLERALQEAGLKADTDSLQFGLRGEDAGRRPANDGSRTPTAAAIDGKEAGSNGTPGPDHNAQAVALSHHDGRIDICA